MAREGYLISIQPLVEQSAEHQLAAPPPLDKKPRTVPPPPAEALVIHTLALDESKRPRPEAVDGIEEVPLVGEHPDPTIQ